MVDRCILLMVNEASRCLEEKVVLDAETVDLGMIMGTGFPPFKGGLLRYADQLGISEVVSRLQVFESRLGERFAPSPTLRRMVETRQNFYEAFQSRS